MRNHLIAASAVWLCTIEQSTSLSVRRYSVRQPRATEHRRESNKIAIGNRIRTVPSSLSGSRSLGSTQLWEKQQTTNEADVPAKAEDSTDTNTNTDDQVNARNDIDSAAVNGAEAAKPVTPSDSAAPQKSRLRAALPNNNANDKLILSTAIPSMVNLAVVPLVNAVDTFWVGRMGIALALAGQSAANSAFFTLYFLVAFVPTITAPLVAEAVASGDLDKAQDRVCESLFLSNLFGGLGTIALVLFPESILKMVLPSGAPAMKYAVPYLRLRGLSMIPALTSATGFAAYRGLLNTVTPLKVSLAANALNLVLDPMMVFPPFNLGFIGAALATAASETMSGMVYIRLLVRRKLATVRKLVQPPKMKALLPILKGGISMLSRQAAINIAIISAARRAQVMDPSGISAAAFGIVNQLYSVGIVVHIAIQGTAAALIPATRAKEGDDKAVEIGDRIFSWSMIVGLVLAALQLLALPFLVPMFSPIPEVQQAVKTPGMIAALLHILNGPVFAGEGAMLGMSQFRDLAVITAASTAALVGMLRLPFAQKSIGAIFAIEVIFTLIQGVGVAWHYLKLGPLARGRRSKESKAPANGNA